MIRFVKTTVRTKFPKIYSLVYPLKEHARYWFCKFNHKVYFGSVCASIQGNDKRYGLMRRLVEMECCGREKREFKVLEIGSWAGGSAIVWADAIKKFNDGDGSVVCVDPWRNYFNLRGDDIKHLKVMAKSLRSGKIFDLFLHNVQASKNHDVIFPFRVSSDKGLQFLGGGFNIVYVDGDHSYKQVFNDLNNSSHLMAEGGILCGDDLECQVSEIDVANAKKNSEIDNTIVDSKVGAYFHPGVTLAVGEFFQGEVSVWEGFWAMRKRADVWEKVVLCP